MLILTDQLATTLRESAVDHFVDEMVAELADAHRYDASVIETGGLTQVVRLGISRAAPLGMTEQGAVRTYLHLMFCLGSFFDSDPQIPWARHILSNPDRIGSQSYVMNRLRDQALEHLEHTNGVAGEHARKFQKKLYDFLLDRPQPVPADDIRRFLRVSFPQKVRQIPDQALDWLATDTSARCEASGLAEQESVLAAAGLRLIYGSWVLQDPRFPWLNSVWDAPAARRDGHFRDAVVGHLDAVRLYIEEAA